MAGVSTVDFTFKLHGEGTKITWAMYGENNLISKCFRLLMSCEKICGPELEKCLVVLARSTAVKP